MPLCAPFLVDSVPIFKQIFSHVLVEWICCNEMLDEVREKTSYTVWVKKLKQSFRTFSVSQICFGEGESMC